MVFYFTATGNCLAIARELDPEPISIPQALQKGDLHFKDSIIGFVVPDYAAELPKIVREFIEKGSFQADYIYMICTYGKEYSVVSEWSYAFLKEHGVDIKLVEVLKMVDNYLPSFDMEEEKAIDKQIPEQLSRIKARIANREEGIVESSPHGREAYAIVSARDPKYNNGSSVYVDTDCCIGCGICSLVCPRGFYQVRDGKACRTSETCDFCLACVHHCPRRAIKLAYLDKNPKARYICPDVKLADIMKANQRIS